MDKGRAAADEECDGVEQSDGDAQPTNGEHDSPMLDTTGDGSTHEQWRTEQQQSAAFDHLHRHMHMILLMRSSATWMAAEMLSTKLVAS